MVARTLAKYILKRKTNNRKHGKVLENALHSWKDRFFLPFSR